MTNEELEAIKQRANAATPGPWTASTWHFLGSTAERRWDIDPIIEIVEDCGSAWMEMRNEDAEFIAHARDDVPALIAEIEYGRRLVANLVEMIWRGMLKATADPAV